MKKYILFLLFSVFTFGQSGLIARQNFGTKKSTFSFILNDYPTAIYAYSFRKLRSAYTGNCIEVRRSSDNSTSNIGFVNNVLDEVSLLSFVGGGGDGFVKTWYDQSGNGYNAIETTNGFQPQIVLSGAVIKKAGKPAIYSPMTAQLNVNNNPPQTYDSAFTVFQNEITGGSENYVLPFTSAGLSSGGNYYGSCENGSSAASYAGWGTPSIYKNGSSSALTNTRGTLYTAFRTGTIVLLSEFTSVSLSLGRGLQYQNTGFRHVCYVQEHITYHSNKTSDKTGIENNINAFYTIY